MANKTFFEKIPAENREQFKSDFYNLCFEQGFQGYETVLLNGVNELLEQYGMDFTVSKSTVWTHAKKYEQSLNRVRETGEIAKKIGDAVGDDEANWDAGLQAVFQSLLYEFVMDKEKLEDSNEAVKLAKAIRDIGQVSIQQKRWKQEIKAKLKTKVAEVEDKQRQLGASEEVIAQSKILLGIFDDS